MYERVLEGPFPPKLFAEMINVNTYCMTTSSNLFLQYCFGA